MGPPRLAPAEIPFQAEREALSYEDEVNGQLVELARYPWQSPLACCASRTSTAHRYKPRSATGSPSALPEEASIGFLQVLDPHHARLRVWERGVSETRSLRHRRLRRVCRDSPGLQSPVQIGLPAARLHIKVGRSARRIMMTGPAVRVYEGQVRL